MTREETKSLRLEHVLPLGAFSALDISVSHKLRTQSFEPTVLVFERPQSLRLVNLHPAVLAPAVVLVLADESGAGIGRPGLDSVVADGIPVLAVVGTFSSNGTTRGPNGRNRRDCVGRGTVE